jgi:competence protein ComEA
MKFLRLLFFSMFLFGTAWADGLVNVNTASAEEIAEAVKGIGPAKAQLIVQYREANGAFTHVDQLVNVKGISLKTVDRIRDQITLEQGGPAQQD